MDALPISSPQPLSLRLRRHIADAHARIEATTTARAMVDGSITRAGYAALLGQLATVHHALERRHPAIAHLGVFPRALIIRGDAAARDALALGGCAVEPAQPTSSLCAWIASSPPAGIIGACYVIAGSLLGSRILRPRLARALGIDDPAGSGLDYHQGADDVATAWPGVLAALDRLGPEWDDQSVLDGALRMIDGLGAIYGRTDSA